MTVPAFLDDFVDDAALLLPADASIDRAVAAHRAHHAGEYAALVGGFLVRDVQVAELAAAVARAPGPSLAVNLVVTAGAGGIEPAVTWVRRSEGLELRAIEFALRDEDDLAHNAERLVRVVDSLGAALDGVTVFAEPPMPPGSLSKGWLAALDELAAREISLNFPAGGPSPDQPAAARLATCIEAALDRELSFKCGTGVRGAVRHRDAESAPQHHGLLSILVATRASLDGAGPDEVARVLAEPDGAAVAARLTADPALAARTRRWFTSVDSGNVPDAHEQLVGLGLLGPVPAGRTGASGSGPVGRAQ